MPHLLLEHTRNLTHPPAHAEVLLALHHALAATEAVQLADLKGRARTVEAVVGDGDPKNAFVHLELRLLTGRDQSVRQRLGKECMRVLRDHYTNAVVGGHCQLSVEIREMERSTYVKESTAAH